VRRSAEVQLRQELLIVSSWSATGGRFPAFIQDDWAQAVPEQVADAELGALVRMALAASRDGVPYPDFRNDAEPARRRKRLLKLAGVRSETEFARSTRSVSIGWQDTEPEMRITPQRNGGRREGFTQMPDQVVTVDASLDDASVGAAVRRALMVATDGTAKSEG
jgi:hypothetical protein